MCRGKGLTAGGSKPKIWKEIILTTTTETSE
jgi:hypothetical protein